MRSGRNTALYLRGETARLPFPEWSRDPRRNEPAWSARRGPVVLCKHRCEDSGRRDTIPTFGFDSAQKGKGPDAVREQGSAKVVDYD